MPCISVVATTQTNNSLLFQSKVSFEQQEEVASFDDINLGEALVYANYILFMTTT